MDDDVPTSANLSPEEIAEELSQNTVEEDDEEKEKKEEEEEEERPLVTSQALKLMDTIRHFLSSRPESGSMLDKLACIEQFTRQSATAEKTQTSLDNFFKSKS